ncbi:hydantoinase B/oxoprolinase family protein [Variovorax sp. RA8]|uniref:hydantoinase B/oxoprolinase family protein n=1 Tax=Variovorax sp. (strain JCM 16519 / RA8) TaxID=662548 RepID=UPI001317DBE3|nr:hydantoinase B/oxoprolinase family protein [Variovorax sp. RA8]VTU42834.1 Acetophenone carboxylase delta subunit [Variovorax sp. RA8]
MNQLQDPQRGPAARPLRTDSVFVEILNNRLNGIVSEMGHVIHKASFTPFIKEAWDFGEALVSVNGEIFSYPRDIGVAFMVAAMMEDAIAAFDHYEPGDVIMANDPSTTGGLCTHLPDIHLLKPYFHDGELVCFTWTFIHSSDVGGIVPGSIALAASDIYQEGIRVPAVKLCRAGQLNTEVMDTFLANCRIPYHNRGDIQAMLSAMQAAEKRLDGTIDKYGLAAFRDGIDDLLDYGEERSRQVLRKLPRGRYEMTDYLELDGDSLPPARMKLAIEVEEDGLHLDFTGSDAQLPFALNLPTFGKNHHFINAGVFNFIYAVDGSIPINRGVLRPLRVTIPPGSLLNPEPTAAIGVRFATVVRVMEMVFGALSQATDGSRPAPREIAGRIPAAGAGMLGVALLSLVDAASGELKVNVLQPLWGGSGARPVKDGIDGADFAAGYLRNIPAETSEAEMPVLVERYQLSDSPPAPGQWRGGLGIDMQFQVFTPNAVLTARGLERYEFRPWGRKGGRAGTLGQTTLNPGSNGARQLGKIASRLDLQPHDVVRIVTPNGGGYGDPLERDPQRVLRDVLDGFLDITTAREDYGVCIADQEVNASATAALRRSRRTDDEPEEFDFGAERLDFEARFPAAWQDELERELRTVPASLRQYWKGRVWQRLRNVPRAEHAGLGTMKELLAELRSELGRRTMG